MNLLKTSFCISALIHAVFAGNIETTQGYERLKPCPVGSHIKKECADSKGAKNCPCELNKVQCKEHPELC